MEVAVWDTYLEREGGLIMHFDILVEKKLTNKTTIFDFGETYLKGKPFKSGKITAKMCEFCHIESAPPSIIDEIKNKGYAIIEIENCN